MEPKSIHDIVPPPQPDNSSAEPPGPQAAGDIPVRTPTKEAMLEDGAPQTKNDDSSFLVPEAPAPAATGKDKQKIKNSKPMPILAIAIAVLALICLAAGAYLKFKT